MCVLGFLSSFFKIKYNIINVFIYMNMEGFLIKEAGFPRSVKFCEYPKGRNSMKSSGPETYSDFRATAGRNSPYSPKFGDTNLCRVTPQYT